MNTNLEFLIRNQYQNKSIADLSQKINRNERLRRNLPNVLIGASLFCIGLSTLTLFLLK